MDPSDNLFQNMHRFQDDLNSLFAESFPRGDSFALLDRPFERTHPHHHPHSGHALVPHGVPRATPALFNPHMDVKDTGSALVFHADLPGMDSSNVKVSVESGVLEISGDRKKQEVRDTERYHIEERSHGTFKRTFRLPSSTKENEVRADFKNGLLTVTCPKEPEKPKPERRQITID